MIYPIVAYGDPVLRKVCKTIDKDYPNLSDVINNMYETMYAAKGIGLAAPQVGMDIRIFIVDGTAMEGMNCENFKRTFINAEIIEETGDLWTYNEGCLSIPDVHEDINRKGTIKIRYYDEDWNEHEEEYDGMTARIIQHEYDHIEGVLFTDYLSAMKKRILKGKLSGIAKGKASPNYRMRFPLKK